MILGRPPALFAAAFAAIINVIVGLGFVVLDSAQTSALNVAFLAIIALIAGTPITDHVALAKASAARAAKKG